MNVESPYLADVGWILLVTKYRPSLKGWGPSGCHSLVTHLIIHLDSQDGSECFLLSNYSEKDTYPLHFSRQKKDNKTRMFLNMIYSKEGYIVARE